jgi:uncharacterized BrkB/YihY/UPF0761 family membrane protein
MTPSRFRGSRFTRPVFMWALATLTTELAVDSLTQHGSAPRLLTLLPLVPALLFLLALVQTVRKMDEMQQRICLESVFFAFVLTLALTFVFASLQRAALYRFQGNDLGTVMMTLWACSYIVTSRRYQ